MINAFDSVNYPDAVPAELTAGARWAWTRSDITAAYPTASYTLKFRFSLQVSPFSDHEIEASKVSSAHVVEAASAVTSLYVPEDYSWQAVVVRDSDSEEVVVDRGFLKVQPDLGSSPGATASWTYQVLVAIRAALLSAASKSQLRMVVGGREIESRSYSELLELEREFSTRWEREKDKANRAAGRSTGRRVLVKMSA